jgi:hypothetical protein
MWRVGAVLVLATALSSCTPWRVTYLQEAVDHATQDQVAERLGPPHRVQNLNEGGTVWAYQHHDSYQGTLFCREYVLTFDINGVLRRWQRQNC